MLVLSLSLAYVIPRVVPSPFHIGASASRAAAANGRIDSKQLCMEVASPPELTMEEQPPAVYPAGCPSCELDWLSRSKEAEAEEQQRLAALRLSNMSGFSYEMWEYAQRMNDTQRQELALDPDVMLRNFIISSCTPPTPLMETVYNATMNRVPYEMACYICGPEQAMLLRTLVGLARPRRALDIGSFTGYGTAAILEALPKEGELTCLEIDRDYTRLAASQLAGRNVNFMVGKAMDALKRFEAEGRQFDFISLDADKPMHGEYYNMSLKLLRPGGVIIMFGKPATSRSNAPSHAIARQGHACLLRIPPVWLPPLPQPPCSNPPSSLTFCTQVCCSSPRSRTKRRWRDCMRSFPTTHASPLHSSPSAAASN